MKHVLPGLAGQCQFSRSVSASEWLRKRIRETWTHQQRNAWAANLGQCISRRMAGGAVHSSMWALMMLPEDIARAAVLTAMEG